MFKYAFYVHSLITVYQIFFQIHSVTCEHITTHRHRMQEFQPITKLSHNTIEEKNRNNHQNTSEKERYQAVIQYFNEDSKELLVTTDISSKIPKLTDVKREDPNSPQKYHSYYDAHNNVAWKSEKTVNYNQGSDLHAEDLRKLSKLVNKTVNIQYHEKPNEPPYSNSKRSHSERGEHKSQGHNAAHFKQPIVNRAKKPITKYGSPEAANINISETDEHNTDTSEEEITTIEDSTTSKSKGKNKKQSKTTTSTVLFQDHRDIGKIVRSKKDHNKNFNSYKFSKNVNNTPDDNLFEGITKNVIWKEPHGHHKKVKTNKNLYSTLDDNTFEGIGKNINWEESHHHHKKVKSSKNVHGTPNQYSSFGKNTLKDVSRVEYYSIKIPKDDEIEYNRESIIQDSDFDLVSDKGYSKKISNEQKILLHDYTKHKIKKEAKKKSPLRANAIEESEEFLPHSIKKQLQCIKKRLIKNKAADIEEEIIGRTNEYNDIVLWKIKEDVHDERKHFRTVDSKKKYADEPPEKKIIFIVHGLTVMGYLDVDCLSKVKSFRTLLGYYMDNLDKFDIFLIPMANPDGVAKLAIDSFWNKNVSPQSACPGVNLDRNFNVKWNSSYAKQMSSCSQNFPGLRAFSEPETQAVHNILHKYGHKIAAYFHVHAGTFDAEVFKGDAILYPKGYTSQSSDDDKYVDLKGDIDEAMRNSTFKVISVNVDSLYNWYGQVLGSSVDYATSIYGIPYGLELVMQIYEDDTTVVNPCLREQNLALTQIWRVLLHVIFESIYRNVVMLKHQK